MLRPVLNGDWTGFDLNQSRQAAVSEGERNATLFHAMTCYYTLIHAITCFLDLKNVPLCVNSTVWHIIQLLASMPQVTCGHVKHRYNNNVTPEEAAADIPQTSQLIRKTELSPRKHCEGFSHLFWGVGMEGEDGG